MLFYFLFRHKNGNTYKIQSSMATNTGAEIFDGISPEEQREREINVQNIKNFLLYLRSDPNKKLPFGTSNPGEIWDKNNYEELCDLFDYGDRSAWSISYELVLANNMIEEREKKILLLENKIASLEQEAKKRRADDCEDEAPKKKKKCANKS